MNDPKTKKFTRLAFTIILVFAIFIIGFFAGRIRIGSSINGTENQYLTGDMKGRSVGVNVDIIWEAWKQIENYYLNKNIDKQKMVYGAIQGIVESLGDEYTQFLSPNETADYDKTSGGEFEGIGAMLRFDGEYTVVDSAIMGFPAQKSGIMPGDVILEVDGKDMHKKGSFEVATAVRGPAGSEVTLKIYRTQDTKEYTFKIKREKIDIQNIALEEVKGSVGYVKILRFNEGSADEFVRLWDSTVDKIQTNNVKTLIIDLRNNPGGLVSMVQYISEDFLNKGDLIMMEEDRDGNRKELRATRDGRLRDKKIVILVNKGTASASEILTGALQYHKKAKVIGEKTVGKGVEQTVITLSDGSTMHIVFRKWLIPDGRQVTKENPINPDIMLEMTTEDFQKGRDPQLDKAWEEAGK